MSSSPTAEFVDSLRAADVTPIQTTVDEFASILPGILNEPAVGVDLPFDGVSLADTPVTVDPTPAQLRTAQTGVTGGELGITEYGSVVLRFSGDGTEFLALYPDQHVVVLQASDVVDDMPAGIDAVAGPIRDASADYIIATGPSATADMGSVVQGVHGPSEVHAIILEDR